jgi:predicted XRE-type DNA-binding protein
MSEFDESNLEQSGSWSTDSEDTHSIAGRARIRAQLQHDIEAFLSQGGMIEEVDTAFRSDAPQKVEIGFNNRSL